MPAPVFEPFLPADFDLYRRELRRDEQYNPHRLRVRRKLKAIGDSARKLFKAEGQDFDLRESLHHPHAFNHRSVVAQWLYLTRTAKEKRVFKSLFGDALGKDVDPAYANIYLAVSADIDGLVVALRIHPEAWYDALNLKNKVQAHLEDWVAVARGAAPGFELSIEGWQRHYHLREAKSDEQRALFKLYTPGEHKLLVALRLDREDPLTYEAELPDAVIEYLRSLIPLYRWIAWSEENAFLKFGGA